MHMCAHLCMHGGRRRTSGAPCYHCHLSCDLCCWTTSSGEPPVSTFHSRAIVWLQGSKHRPTYVYTTRALTYWATSLAHILLAHYSLMSDSGVNHMTRNKVNASLGNEQRIEYMSCNICRRLDPGRLLITTIYGCPCPLCTMLQCLHKTYVHPSYKTPGVAYNTKHNRKVTYTALLRR